MEGNKNKRTTSFSIEVFDDAQFDPSAFVASTRSLIPLERLRDELQGHLNDRKQELYDLINRDYADFILVSSKLSGVGGKVADLREPMARLLSRASGLRSAAQLEASRLEAKLEERGTVREQKASIERCLRFVSTLETAESLLGIADGRAGDDDDDDEGRDHAADGTDDLDGGVRKHLGGVVGRGGKSRLAWEALDVDEGFDDPDLLAAFPGLSTVKGGGGKGRPGDAGKRSPGPGSRAQTPPAAGDTEDDLAGDDARAEAECALLERAAHYALMMSADLQTAAEEEANSTGDASATSLLKSLSSRAARIESEVTRRLRSEFAKLVKPPPLRPGLAAGTVPSPGGTIGVLGDVEASGAAPAVTTSNGSDAAGSAASACGGGGRERRRALLSCLRPFSALGSGIEAEKQFARCVVQPFLETRFTQGIVDGGERGSSKGLGPLLRELLEHIKEVAGDALSAAEEMLGVPVDGSEGIAETKANSDQGTAGVAPLPVDLVCNGIWRPVQQVLMTKLSSIFATGMVTVQRTNYELCMEFLEGLSGVCGEDKRLHLRRRLLAQETVVEFKARWNLPIYFQLRARGVSARLEAALESAHGRGVGSGDQVIGVGDEPGETPYRGPSFDLPAFPEAWRCLELCWNSEVFLPCLSHRFLRLSLQCIARIGAWAGSAEVLALPPDDIVPVASDLNRLLLSLQSDYVDTAARSLSARAPGERHRDGLGAFEEGEAKALMGEAIREAVGAWEPLVDRLWEKATSQVAEQCTAMLQAVKGITATYRMTNKPAPQRPSPFVPNVLRALREFDERWGTCASDKETDTVRGKGDGKATASAGWKDRAVVSICSRYLEIVSELLLTVKQMENTLNKRRVMGRRGTRVNAADQGPSDRDKIMMQLRLDVAEFGREAARLGVDLFPSEPYMRLLEVVEATPREPRLG